MYCGGGKGRCARRACGVGEAAGCACPNAAVAARLDNATARKHFFAARLNSNCLHGSLQDLFCVRRKAEQGFWHYAYTKTSGGSGQNRER